MVDLSDRVAPFSVVHCVLLLPLDGSTGLLQAGSTRGAQLLQDAFPKEACYLVRHYAGTVPLLDGVVD